MNYKAIIFEIQIENINVKLFEVASTEKISSIESILKDKDFNVSNLSIFSGWIQRKIEKIDVSIREITSIHEANLEAFKNFMYSSIKNELFSDRLINLYINETQSRLRLNGIYK